MYSIHSNSTEPWCFNIDCSKANVTGRNYTSSCCIMLQEQGVNHTCCKYIFSLCHQNLHKINRCLNDNVDLNNYNHYSQLGTYGDHWSWQSGVTSPSPAFTLSTRRLRSPWPTCPSHSSLSLAMQMLSLILCRQRSCRKCSSLSSLFLWSGRKLKEERVHLSPWIIAIKHSYPREGNQWVTTSGIRAGLYTGVRDTVVTQALSLWVTQSIAAWCSICPHDKYIIKHVVSFTEYVITKESNVKIGSVFRVLLLVKIGNVLRVLLLVK